MKDFEAQQRTTTSFEQVIESNKDKIYRISRVYAVAPLEPQDLFQEVVYQIWKSFSAFKGDSGIDTWVYKIALNVCLRSKLKLEKSTEKMVRLDSLQFVPPETSPDLHELEKQQALQDCIATLNNADQSLLILLLEGLPYKQIATVTGLTENHVAVKLKRIKKLLFDCITPKLA
uniref:RNA polymerase sigma factor n=1 Tax=Roseivirga sp. TaxID=1964215 RepID=UPI0040484C72